MIKRNTFFDAEYEFEGEFWEIRAAFTGFHCHTKRKEDKYLSIAYFIINYCDLYNNVHREVKKVWDYQPCKLNLKDIHFLTQEEKQELAYALENCMLSYVCEARRFS